MPIHATVPAGTAMRRRAVRLMPWPLMPILIAIGIGVAASGIALPLRPRPDRPAPPPDQPNLEARLRAHVAALAGANGTGSRVVFTAGNRWSTDYIIARMQAYAADVRGDTFMVARRSLRAASPLVNPMAVVPGEVDSALVLCAHLDASASRDPGWKGGHGRMRAPGADDNATGVAVMLEVLALVANAGRPPHYTLIFAACNAEERNPDYAGLGHRDAHHLGSRRLAGVLAQSGRPIRGVIAMDMVGFNPRAHYLPVFSTSRSRWLARDLVAARDRAGIPLELGAGAGPCDKSDNESFDRAGMPAVLLMESCAPWRSDPRHPRNPGYHTARDLPSAVTWPIVVKTARLVAAYVLGA